MRTNIYIDGFNLYYGVLKGTPDGLTQIEFRKFSCRARKFFMPVRKKFLALD